MPSAALLIAAPPSDEPLPVNVEPDDLDAALGDVVDAAAVLRRVGVDHVHAHEPERAGGDDRDALDDLDGLVRPVADGAAGLGVVALAERDTGDGDVLGGRVDVEQAVETADLRRQPAGRRAGVDDRRRRTGAGDRQRGGDVEVAVVGEVVVDRRDGDRVGAGGEGDRVGAGEGVGLLDRGAQRARAGAGLAGAVADVGVDTVVRAVDDHVQRCCLLARRCRERQHRQRKADGNRQQTSAPAPLRSGRPSWSPSL